MGSCSFFSEDKRLQAVARLLRVIMARRVTTIKRTMATQSYQRMAWERPKRPQPRFGPDSRLPPERAKHTTTRCPSLEVWWTAIRWRQIVRATMDRPSSVLQSIFRHRPIRRAVKAARKGRKTDSGRTSGPTSGYNMTAPSVA